MEILKKNSKIKYCIVSMSQNISETLRLFFLDELERMLLATLVGDSLWQVKIKLRYLLVF